MHGLGETNYLNRKVILTYLFIYVLWIDLTLLSLTLSHYYFLSLRSSGYAPVIVLNILYVYLLVIIISKNAFWKVFWGVFGPLFASPFFIICWLFLIFIYPNFHYYELDAPKGTDSLIIEHRNWSLGETHHLYNLYQGTLFPGLVKKINGETVDITTRFTDADDLEVLGVNHAEWIGTKKVIFHSVYAETSIELK